MVRAGLASPATTTAIQSTTIIEAAMSLDMFLLPLASNASGHRTERATRAPVRCTALLARDAKHPQDLVPVAAERHTHRAIIDLCSPVLQPDTLQSLQP